MDNWMPEIGGDHGIDNSVDNYIEGRRSLWGWRSCSGLSYR